MKKILFLMVCLFTLGMSVNAQEKGKAFIEVGTNYTNTDMGKRLLDATFDESKNLFGGQAEVGLYVLDNLAVVGGFKKASASDLEQITLSAKLQYTMFRYFLVEAGYAATKIESQEFKHNLLTGIGAILPINKSKTLAVVPKVNMLVEPHWKNHTTRFNTAFDVSVGLRLTL